MRPIVTHASAPVALSTPRSAVRATPASPASHSTATRPGWRRLVCSLVLAMGLVTLTTAPMAQPAFADQWCTDC
jgi:hypothetical protein